MTTPTLNLSRRRRRTALSWIRGEGLLTSPISYEAKLLAVLALLLCDDAGRVKQDVLNAAVRDPSAVQVGRTLLAEAGN